MPTSAEQAAREVFRGIPPDDGAWHGGPPRLAIDYTSAKVLRKIERQQPDGSTVMAATLEFGRGIRAGGIKAESFLFQRFLKVYPNGEAALLQAFEEATKDQWSVLQASINERIGGQRFAGHVLMDIVGFRESAEWSNPQIAKLGVVKRSGEVTLDRGEIMEPFTVEVAIKATKKAPVTKAPFAAMSDAELNKWIERWANEAPENFWMDGELKVSRPAAFAMYRKRWRAMLPRDQVDMMESLKSGGRYASTGMKCATKLLQWEKTFYPSRILRNLTRSPAYSVWDAKTSDGWQANITENFGQSDWDDRPKKKRFITTITDPDGDSITKTFYRDENEAYDFAEQMRSRFLQSGAKDPRNYGIQMAVASSEEVVLELYYRVSPKSSKDRPSVQFYYKPLVEAVEGMTKELIKRKLDPRQIVVEQQNGGFPHFRTFQDIINFANGVEMESTPSTPPPVPSSAPTEQMRILETLLGKDPDPFVQESLVMLQRGESLDEEQLKGLRHRLYKNRMRPEADMFRMAHDRQAGIEADSDGSYMSVGYLKALAEKSQELLKYIDNDTPLPDWVEAKIGQAANDINSVRDYFAYNKDREASKRVASRYLQRRG